ncbi:MAG: hypothetical protein V7K64_04750 [Nostoc sp.]|uniref:hypothetical protein n=1 Tax=unclassified Nostoc TaxID=2593658 RepID=UPI001D25DDD9|nr:hypothetical protein [Nostoc sp. JL34]MBN3887241.1 hypothetical protein [Nostoc sp. JL34]
MNPSQEQDQSTSNVFIEGELSEEDLMKIIGGLGIYFKFQGQDELYTRQSILFDDEGLDAKIANGSIELVIK